MRPLIKIFFVGMGISFLGSLPLGTLNIAAMQIAITDGYSEALWFATGVFLVEIFYVRLSLVAMDKIRKHEKILKALEWVTLFIVVALAVSSFVAAAKNNPQAKNIILSNTMHRFILGFMMSAVNPVQIPFWFGWSTVLFTKKVLLPKGNHYNIYILGIGLGTMFGFCVFIFGGSFIVDKLNANQSTLNWVIGGIFSLTALIQLWRMMRHKDAVQKIHNIKEEELHPERLAEQAMKKDAANNS